MKNITSFFEKFKDKTFRRIFILVLLVVLLIGGVFYYFKKEGRVVIDNSQVSAPIINIAPESPGTLNEIDVNENQIVKKGDLLGVVGTQSIRAQTDGIIIQANKQIGSTLTGASSLVQIMNLDDFRIVGTIDENKGLKDIKTGQVASFTVDAFPGQTFWGYINDVAPSAKQTQIAFSISNERPTQQFNVFVRFDANKYPQLKNGMSAKLTIFTKTN